MLTDDMTRLCGEIVAMRNARGGLMGDLQREAKARRQDVVGLCTHFGHARMAMAKQTRDDRVAFMNQLKNTVGAQLRNVQNDLAGARQAWAGKSA